MFDWRVGQKVKNFNKTYVRLAGRGLIKNFNKMLRKTFVMYSIVSHSIVMYSIAMYSIAMTIPCGKKY